MRGLIESVVFLLLTISFFWPANLSSHNKVLSVPVTVTAYAPLRAQTDSTPFTTASNQRVRTGICALSRDLEKHLDLEFGDSVHIAGIGTYEFQDRMNKRWKKRVDIFFWKNKDAKKFGIRKSQIIIGRKMS